MEATGVSAHVAGVRFSALGFADDVVLIADSLAGLQRSADAATEWAAQHNAKFNIKKCAVMAAGRKAAALKGVRRAEHRPIRLSGQAVPLVDTFTYLGTAIGQDGSVKAAVRQAMESARRQIAADISRRVGGRDGISPAVQSRLFTSLVLPGLLYGSELWGVFLTAAERATMDSIQHDLLRRVMHVASEVPNEALRAEFDVRAVSSRCAERVIRWYLRVLRDSTDERYRAAMLARRDTGAPNGKGLFVGLKRLLKEWGLSMLTDITELPPVPPALAPAAPKPKPKPKDKSKCNAEGPHDPAHDKEQPTAPPLYEQWVRAVHRIAVVREEAALRAKCTDGDARRASYLQLKTKGKGIEMYLHAGGNREGSRLKFLARTEALPVAEWMAHRAQRLADAQIAAALNRSAAARNGPDADPALVERMRAAREQTKEAFSPLCKVCGRADETADHFLFQCAGLRNARHRLRETLSARLQWCGESIGTELDAVLSGCDVALSRAVLLGTRWTPAHWADALSEMPALLQAVTSANGPDIIDRTVRNGLRALWKDRCAVTGEPDIAATAATVAQTIKRAEGERPTVQRARARRTAVPPVSEHRTPSPSPSPPPSPSPSPPPSAQTTITTQRVCQSDNECMSVATQYEREFAYQSVCSVPPSPISSLSPLPPSSLQSSPRSSSPFVVRPECVWSVPSDGVSASPPSPSAHAQCEEESSACVSQWSAGCSSVSCVSSVCSVCVPSCPSSSSSSPSSSSSVLLSVPPITPATPAMRRFRD